MAKTCYSSSCCCT